MDRYKPVSVHHQEEEANLENSSYPVVVVEQVGEEAQVAEVAAGQAVVVPEW
jgi:hypothetical protein